MKALNEVPISRRAVGITMALIALAIALLAVATTAGSTQAQEGVGPPPQNPRTGDNTEEYSAPVPCSEEAEPKPNTKKVIDSGHYAVFDAFWDYEVGHMSNNFCPPSVTHRTEDDDEGEEITVSTRAEANTHISETVFSVPDRYKVTVVDSGVANGNPSTAAEPKIDLNNYPFLKAVVSAVKPGPDSTAENPTTVFANNSVWWVKAENVPANTGANTPLILGFSTDLMEEADWYLEDGPDEGTEPDPPVQFQLAAVHVLKDGSPQEAHVVGANFFAFDPGASQDNPQWSTVTTATHSEINMFTDQYRHMQYVFTKPGQYLVQAKVQGHVRSAEDRLSGAPANWSPIHPGAKSITSPGEWYTFHVGPEDDLSVTLAHTDETSDAATTISDSTASFTVTATNTGPEDAMDAIVQVRLPEGLTYKDGSARIGSATTAPPSSVFNYGCGVISWQLGRFGNYGTLEEGETRTASPATLTFTADVASSPDPGGRLTATAEIRNADRQAVDSDPDNDISSATVLRSSSTVRPPFFEGGVTRSIPENAVAGAYIDIPAAANPDARTLTYSLSGPCTEGTDPWFKINSGTGRIVLAKSLDYHKQWAFPLTVGVSDGVNAAGAADTSADASIPVMVQVTDMPADAAPVSVTFTRSRYQNNKYPTDLDRPIVNETLGITPHLHNLPPAVENLEFGWEGPYGYIPFWLSNGGLAPTEETPGTHTYTLHIRWTGSNEPGSYSAEITVTYSVEWFPYQPES